MSGDAGMTDRLRRDLPPLPLRMRGLPIDKRGFPVPWFVAQMGPGEWDFRVIEDGKRERAWNHKLCWICGQPLGRYKANCAVQEREALFQLGNAALQWLWHVEYAARDR